jgi:HSP20 family protein
MSLIPWSPFKDIVNISRDMSDFFYRTPFDLFTRSTSPLIDLYESNSDIVVKAEIPGVSKEDLNVYVDENTIKLSGQAKKDTEYKDENIYRTERFYGNFSRTIPLPMKVKSEQAKAEYKDGILKITVPKTETTQTKGKRIDIH